VRRADQGCSRGPSRDSGDRITIPSGGLVGEERLRFCCVAARSGKTQRHRLHRGGDRQEKLSNVVD